VTIGFRVLLPTQEGFPGIPEWELDLQRENNTLTGICYAIVEGRFRLPYWVQLTK
jgi:hypothetical protein